MTQHNPRQTSILPGVILVIVGVALLGEKAHWWQLNWFAVIHLWPVALILLGLRLLLPPGRRADWLLATLIAIGAVAVISVPGSTLNRLTGQSTRENRTSNIMQDGAGNIEALKLHVITGASSAQFGSLAAGDSRVYTAVSHGANLVQQYEATNGRATAELTMDGNWLDSTGDLTIQLSRRPSLDLNLEVGASRINVDATNLNLTNLRVDGGASHSQITLGSLAAKTTVAIDGGAMDLTLRVPKSAGLKITDDSGASSTNISDLGLNKSGSTSTSAGFETAAQQITIQFDAGAARLLIERY